MAGHRLAGGQRPDELVLASSRRPQWLRRVDNDSANFDGLQVGWPWQEPPYRQDGASEDERKHLYDTTIPGTQTPGIRSAITRTTRSGGRCSNS